MLAGGIETMAGIKEADGRVVSQQRAVDSLLLLLGTHLGPITGGAQLMLMATTTQVAEPYLSLTFLAVACCFPFPRREEAARGTARGGSGRGGG